MAWAVTLIIDVVENLRRQETKLPAVPPIMTLSQKDGRQRQCIPSPEPPHPTPPTPCRHIQRKARSHSGRARMCGQTHAQKNTNKKHIHTHILSQNRHVSHTHTQTHWRAERVAMPSDSINGVPNPRPSSRVNAKRNNTL